MSRPSNHRLQDIFLPAQGRKLVILSGEAVGDLYYLGDLHGPQRLVWALHQIGRAEGYEISVRLDRSGDLSFGDEAMRQRFDELTVEPTRDRQGEPPKREFQPRPRSDRPAAAPATAEPVERVDASAVPPLRTAIGRIERVLRGNSRTLVLFEGPEELWLPGSAPTASAFDLLKQAVLLATEAAVHPESRVVFVVKPGRRQELVTALDQIAATSPHRQDLPLGAPGPEEVRAFLDSECLRHGLVGDRAQVIAGWTQRGGMLRNLDESLKGLMQSASGQRRIERVLERRAPVETAERVLHDLDRFVGLAGVKEAMRGLLRFVEQQARDRREGRTTQPISTHMLFLGSPGTGKTEVARIVARYLRAVGIRATGELVEISRTDIASRFNSGECITRMAEALDRAVGGVLFVDEAYQLAEGEWMRGALESLMKGMEDRRETTTVILAGYEQEMQALWDVNPGFRSRIPEANWFRFPDYSAAELGEIFLRQCVQRGLELDDRAAAMARRFIEAEARRGRFGNGRGVRNLVERVVQRRADLGGGPVTQEMVPEPAGYRSDEVERLLADLDTALVGARALKEYLERVGRQARRAAERDRPVVGPFHCRFVGPPGTGKTTAARLVGPIFHAMGLLSRGHLVEVDPIAAFGSAYAGEYAQRVAEQFERARGGVLFIDEAYQLTEAPLGPQILHQIVQTLTGQAFADTLVIMAGYRDRMNGLLQANAGLADRIREEIVFEPFPTDALVRLFHREIDEHDYVTDPVDRPAFDRTLAAILEARRSAPEFAGARSLKGFVHEVLDRQARRILASPTPRKYLIIAEDLGEPPSRPEDLDRYLDELDARFVGMRPVKDKIRLIAKRARKEAGRGGQAPKAPRLLLLGNPGTGKTTAARELARALRSLGCLTSDREVVVRGTELQGSYLGQSKDRVLDAFRDSRGGILFIDEAYTLASLGELASSYAREVVDTITGQTELAENAHTAIVLAGYTDAMEQFLSSNRGLASRFPEKVHFPDYSAEECLKILGRWYERVEPGDRLPLEDAALRATLIDAFDRAKALPNFGNARDVENLGEMIREAILLRPDDDPRGAAAPSADDIYHGLNRWMESRFL